MFEYKKTNKTQYCQHCGRKLEPKVVRIKVTPPPILAGRTHILCYQCVDEALLDLFYKRKEN